eukprot:g2450.t1
MPSKSRRKSNLGTKPSTFGLAASGSRRQSITPMWSSAVTTQEARTHEETIALRQEVEASFDHHQASQYKKILRNFFLFLFFLNPVFVVFDYYSRMGTEEDRAENADDFYRIVAFRFGCLAPLCIVILCFLASNWYKRNPDLLTIPVTMMGISLVAYIILSKVTNDRAGIMILYCCFVSNFTPLRSRQLMICNYLICTLVVLSLFVLKEKANMVNAVTSIILLICCNGLITFTSFKREKGLIENMIQDKHLQQHQKELKAEEKVSENLLCSMMPKFLIEQLKARQSESEVLAEDYKEVTVLFSIIDNFSNLATKLNPQGVVHCLNIVFSHFDHLLDKYENKVHKVETVGEVYLTVSGAPGRSESHGVDAGNFALAMMAQMPMVRQEIKDKLKSLGSDSSLANIVDKLHIKIGLHTGPIVAGVVGLRNPRYKLFGDTVNTSSRMESTSEPGKIGCSDSYRDKFVNQADPNGVEDHFVFEKRAKFQGLGPMGHIQGLGLGIGKKTNSMRLTAVAPGRTKKRKSNAGRISNAGLLRAQQQIHAGDGGMGMGGGGSAAAAADGGGGGGGGGGGAGGGQGPTMMGTAGGVSGGMAGTIGGGGGGGGPGSGPGGVVVGGGGGDLSGAMGVGVGVDEASLYQGTAIESISGDAEMHYRELLAQLRESQKEVRLIDGGGAESKEEVDGVKAELSSFEFELRRHDVLRLKMTKHQAPELPISQALWILFGPNPKLFGTRLGSEDEAAYEASYRARHYYDFVQTQQLYTVMWMVLLGIVTICDYFLSRHEDAADYCNYDCFSKTRLLLRLAISLPALFVYLLFLQTRAFFKYQGYSTYFVFLLVGMCEAGCSAASRAPGYELLALLIMCQYSFSVLSYSSRIVLGLSQALLFAVIVIMFKPWGETRSPLDVFWPEIFLFGFIGFFAISGIREEMIERVRHNNALTMKVQDMKLNQEKEKTSALLHNLLPSSVVDELRSGRSLIADYYQQVTVLFTDMKNFTLYSSNVTCGELVTFLNAMYSRFDQHSVSERVNELA